MYISVTQKKTLDLIAYATERGWAIDRFESWRPSLSGRPRFLLSFQRTDDGPFPALFSIQLFVGSGRVSGTYVSIPNFGKAQSFKIGNWSQAYSHVLGSGRKTEEDLARAAREWANSRAWILKYGTDEQKAAVAALDAKKARS